MAVSLLDSVVNDNGTGSTAISATLPGGAPAAGSIVFASVVTQPNANPTRTGWTKISAQSFSGLTHTLLYTKTDLVASPSFTLSTSGKAVIGLASFSGLDSSHTPPAWTDNTVGDNVGFTYGGWWGNGTTLNSFTAAATTGALFAALGQGASGTWSGSASSPVPAGLEITSSGGGGATGKSSQRIIAIAAPGSGTTLANQMSASGAEGMTIMWYEWPAASSGDVTLTTTAGNAAADGGSGAMTGTQNVTLTTTAGNAAADGGTGSMSAATNATLTTTAGDAPAAGGTGAFTGGATLTSTAGDAPADGGTGSMSGTANATFSTTAGAATADGGTGSMSGTGANVFTTTTGNADAAGSTGSFSGTTNATFSTDEGQAFADGGTGSMSGNDVAAVFETTTGDAVASGDPGSFFGSSGATFATTTGSALADGGVGSMAPTVVLTTTAGDALAAAGAGSMSGTAAFQTTSGDADADGGVGSLQGLTLSSGVNLRGWTFRVITGGITYETPDWDGATVMFDMDDVGSFQGSYPTRGVNSIRVVDDSIVIAYFDGVEPFDGRWRIMAGKSDATDDAPITQFVGRSLLDIFRRVTVPASSAGPTYDVTNVTPGNLLHTLFTAAQAAGKMTGITWNFSTTLDSNGVAWDNTKLVTLEIKRGTKFIDILRDLYNKGLVDFRFNGTQFQMFKADTMGIDRSSLVAYVAGRDYEELPTQWSSVERAKKYTVYGDDNTFVEKTDNTVPTGPFGIEEIALSQGGTKDAGTLTIVGDAALNQVKNIREQMTRKVVINATTPIPMIDFQVGDWIAEMVPGDVSNDIQWEKFRVRTIVLDIDEGGNVTKASITLNDKFLEDLIKAARKIDSITGGISGSNGVPTTPPETVTDTTTPNAPTSLTFSSETYQDQEGRTLAIMVVNWVAPTQNTNGSALTDLDGYEISYKREGTANWIVDTIETQTYVASGLIPGGQYRVRVRAYDDATPRHYSGYLGTSAGQLSPALMSDTTPPSQPVAPTTSSARGIIQVYHGWLKTGGGNLESDTIAVEIHMSQTSGFAPDSSTLYASLLKPGQVAVGGLTQNGNPYFFKVVAVDRSGNRSLASAQTSQVLNRIQGPDLEANSVTTNELSVGSVDADIIGFGVLSTNLINDPGFEDSYDFTTWTAGTQDPDFTHQWRKAISAATSITDVIRNETQAHAGRKRSSIRLKPGAAISDKSELYSNAFQVKADTSYRISYSATSYGAGASTAGGTKLYVDAIFGNAAGTITGTTTISLSDGGFTTIPYTPLSSTTSDSYAGFSEDLVIPPGQTDLWCVLRFRVTDNGSDFTVMIDDIAAVEVGLGGALEITAAGIRWFNNVGDEVIAIMTSRPNYITVEVEDGSTAGITDTATIFGKEGRFNNDVTIADVPVVGSMGPGFTKQDTVDYLPNAGRDLEVHPIGIAEQSAGGMVGRIYATPANLSQVVTSGQRYHILTVAADLLPGRSYNIKLNSILTNITAMASTDTNAITGYYVRCTTDGSDPSHTNGSILGYNYMRPPTNGFQSIPYWEHRYDNGADTIVDLRVAFIMVVENCTTQIYSSSANLHAVIEDAGMRTATTGEIINLKYADSTPTAPPATKKTYVATYGSNNWYTYRSKNTLLRGREGSVGDTSSKVYQGYSSSGSFNGNQRGLWTFPSITSFIGTGNATKIEAHINWSWWWYNDGGTAILKLHSYLDGGAPTGSLPSLVDCKSQVFGAKSGWQWITIPSSFYAGFKSGTYKGFGIGPAPSTSQEYYGYADDIAEMRVTVYK